MATKAEIIAARFTSRQTMSVADLETTRYRPGADGELSAEFQAHWKRSGLDLLMRVDTVNRDSAVVTIYRSDIAAPQLDSFVLDSESNAWIICKRLEKNYVFTRVLVEKTTKTLFGNNKK
jgi:hypothetical protein